jgi:hypothetical protein
MCEVELTSDHPVQQTTRILFFMLTVKGSPTGSISIAYPIATADNTQTELVAQEVLALASLKHRTSSCILPKLDAAVFKTTLLIFTTAMLLSSHAKG